jgi:outer membrane usher protein
MSALRLAAGLAAGLLAVPEAGWAQGLPPAPLPGAASAMSGVTLYLELVVNTQPTGQVVPVLLKDGHYHVAAHVLRPLHVRTPAADNELVAVSRIDGVGVRYDSVAQRLELTLPPEWLPGQQVDAANAACPFAPLQGSGFLLNYDVYASNPGRSTGATSLWTEQRWFGGWGVLSNTGIARRNAHQGGMDTITHGDGYLRYDTQWRYADLEAVRTWTVGDLITGALGAGSAVRLGGIQVARSFAIRPDLVPYPLPQFAGQAAVPSAVDLFINGQRASRSTVQPGPFTLNTMPFINGAGEASVVTTDALGRQVLTTVPFYVATSLLKAGTTDYTLAAGALRRRYGVDSFGYGRAVATGSLRYGWSDALTLQTRAEAARGLLLAGGGATVRLGTLGVANGSLAHGGSGIEWTLGYQYNAPRFGVSAQHTQRTAGWRDLTRLETMTSQAAARRTTQVTASISLGRAGALAAGYFDAASIDSERLRLATASYSVSVGARSFVALNLNKSVGRGDYTVQLQWIQLLDERGTVNLMASRDRHGTSGQVQSSRTPPSSGGLGWNLSYANGGGRGDYHQASAIWRGDFAQVQGGVYTQGGRSATWAGATGSVVMMDGGIFVANRINDAFALVSTGVPNVPIRFENQLIGRTNARGHLLVTGVSAYHPARFELDTLELPAYMQSPQAERRVVLRAGSGALLRFEIEQVLAATITLVDEQGRPLPVGLAVQHTASGRGATLGWDGQVYLEGLGRDNELLVRGVGFGSCSARFVLSDLQPGVSRVGPLVCRPLPSTALLGHGPAARL